MVDHNVKGTIKQETDAGDSSTERTRVQNRTKATKNESRWAVDDNQGPEH